MMKKTLILSILILLTGCESDYNKGFETGERYGRNLGIEEYAKNHKEVIEQTIDMQKQSKKIFNENQEKQTELDQKLEEINLIQTLWKSAAYPDLVMTRGLIVNVPIFSVWLLPFAVWVIGLSALWAWFARKMHKRTKPTDDELRIMKEAQYAKTIIDGLKNTKEQLQAELAEFQQTKAKAQQQAKEANQELENELKQIKTTIQNNRTELKNLQNEKQILKKEIEDMTV